MGARNRPLVQLCWTCKYACDSYACKWVRTLKKHYKGTELDKDGYIVKCPKYEHDGLIYTAKDKAKALGISYERYKVIQVLTQRLKNKGIETVEDYLKYKEEKKFVKFLEQKYTDSQIKYARYIIKRKNLNMSEFDYIEKYILPKKNKNSRSKEYQREYGRRKYREKVERELKNE